VSDPVASQAFEALLTRSGNDLLILLDERTRIVRCGPEAAGLAERTADELAGMSVIAAFGSAALDRVARQALETGQPATGEVDLGRRGARQFAVEAVPLAGGVVVALHDVTALRRAERTRRDFVANVSHELRTPVAAIKLLAETLAAGPVGEAATEREFAQQIAREADHLAHLIDELLELSTIESGQVQLGPEPLDPDAVVATCVERITPVAEQAGVRVVACPGNEASVRAHADAARLGRALLNLAHNAVKYSHRGGEVRIGWRAGPERVRFAVADDGIGVPRMHQPRIFERFYKVDRARTRGEFGAEQPSAGLGLAIVRRIAEAHRGEAGFTSEEGAGSTFWIEVPRAAYL
jgi:two-component system, OmpR family, phosphate regulon sensor histidine kinase PhoR